MSTNTLLIGAAVVAAVLYVRSQQNSGGMGRVDPNLGATPVAAQPGFGFNLGFFKND